MGIGAAGSSAQSQAYATQGAPAAPRYDAAAARLRAVLQGGVDLEGTADGPGGTDGRRRSGPSDPLSRALSQPVVARGPRRFAFRPAVLPVTVATQLHAEQAALARRLPASDPECNAVPSQFTHVLPLDVSDGDLTTGSTGYVSRVYKAVRRSDGAVLAIRRVDGAKVAQARAAEASRAWAVLEHPCVVSLRTAFVTAGALFLAHDYHPCAESAAERIRSWQMRGAASGTPAQVAQRTSTAAADAAMGGAAPTAGSVGPDGLPSEGALWRWAVDLFLGLRAAHARGLAFGAVPPTQVLFTAGDRVRLSGSGVMDVLEADRASSVPLAERQAGDVRAVARVLLQLSLGSVSTLVGAEAAAIKQLQSTGRRDLATFLEDVLNGAYEASSVVGALQDKVSDRAGEALREADALRALLAGEHGSGRLLRVLLKMGFVMDRPEQQADPSWSRAGEKHLLSLFRDFVFHQQDSGGAPALDVGHAVEALTRLDLGDEQAVALPSRDGQSMLTADYATVRESLEESFGVLRGRAAAGKGPTGLETAAWARAGAGVGMGAMAGLGAGAGAGSVGEGGGVGVGAADRRVLRAAGAGGFQLGGS